ncbi:hypothetical protein Tco_0929203 [Tanacetum coccineum]
MQKSRQLNLVLILEASYFLADDDNAAEEVLFLLDDIIFLHSFAVALAPGLLITTLPNGESLLNRDTSMVSSPKIDSLLEEFSSKLAHIDLIPPGIDEADFDLEEDIRLVEKLLYDNSSPRPSEELNSKISDAII